MNLPIDVAVRWPRRARNSVLAVWALSVCTIAAVQFHPRMDNAVRLIGISLSVLLSLMVPLALYCLYSTRPRWQRVALMALPFAPVVVFIFFFKLTNVTGSLEPQFRSRWSDESVALPEAVSSPSVDAPRADLSSTTVDDWPQFLGPDRNQSVDGITFATNWSERPPREVWRQPIGAGWSSFVAVNGYAVTQEQRDAEELVSCYEIATGRLIWAQPIQARHETFLGGIGPRSTPTIEGGRVYALGATGVFRCLQGDTGQELWRHDLRDEYRWGEDAGVAWGRSPSPLMVDDLVVLPVGGPAGGPSVSLVAWDKVTGERRWQVGDRQTGYASPVLAELLGVRQILLVTEDALISVNPEGRLLWTYDWPGQSTAAANVTNAVAVSENRVFVSKGYGAGAALLEVRSGGQDWEVTEVWRNTGVMKTKFSNVIVHENCIFGLDDVMLECLEIETGRKRWKHRGSYGFGQVLRVGSSILVMGEDGQLTALAASTEKALVLGSFPALAAKTWNNPCLFGRFLLVRNGEEAACFELADWERGSR